jgi:hypothetical protein
MRWLGAFNSLAVSSDGGRRTFLVCLVACAGRLDETCGRILAGPERFTQSGITAGQSVKTLAKSRDLYAIRNAARDDRAKVRDCVCIQRGLKGGVRKGCPGFVVSHLTGHFRRAGSGVVRAIS